MKQKYTLLIGMLIFSFIKLSATDYYWVGGSGNWTDLTHWSLTSGGGVNPIIVPSPFDNIYFDGNSGFTSSSNTVTINVPNVFCKNMDWTGAANNPNFISTQGSASIFSIYGSITFIPTMTFQFDGTILFLATNTISTITSGGQHFDGDLKFNGINSSWSLLDSLSATTVFLEEGSFYSNAHPVRTEQFWANTNSLTMDTLNLNQSNIHLFAGESIFQVESTITGDPQDQKHLKTNFDNVNFYFDYLSNNSLVSNRILYLNLIDTTYINDVFFGKPNNTTPQTGAAYDKIIATGKVYIDDAEMNNKSVVEHVYDGQSTTDLIHIDTLITFKNGNYPSGTLAYNDFVSDCDCGYVKLAKGVSGVFSGDYGTVHFLEAAAVANGYFDTIIAEGVITLYTEDLPNSADFQGTFITKASLQKDGYFYQDELSYPLVFDTLSLTRLHFYNFQNTITFTQNGWLDAVGLCDEPIVMRAINHDQNFIIDAAANTIEVEYTVVEHSTATGTANFLGLNSMDKEGNIGWNFTPPPGRTLYWVGGAGNWDDAAHWSLTSGGVGGECMPTIYDDVFFNANSGLNAGDIVNVNIRMGYCKSMDWTGTTTNPIFETTLEKNLFIHGSLTFVPDMTLQSNGTIWFSSTSSGNTITTAGQHFDETVRMEGTDGSWILQDSLSVDILELNEGDFYSNNNSIRVGEFTAENASSSIDTLNIFQSNIYLYKVDSKFKIVSDFFNNGNKLRTNLNQTNFYYTNTSTNSRYLDLRLTDTAYINDVLFYGFSGGTGGNTDYIRGNGAVYINYAEIKWTGRVGHSENATTTDIIHIDTTHLFSTGNQVLHCECNYILSEGSADVQSGLYGTVIIKSVGNIYNGYFAYVCIEDLANVSATVVPPPFDYVGTFIQYGHMKSDGNFYQITPGYPLQFDTLKLTAGKLYEFLDTISFTQNGWLDAVGECDLPITLKPYNNDPDFQINALCDTISIQYCILEESTGLGNAAFIGTNTVDNGGNIGWTLAPPAGRTLYWIGGTGDWSNSQNWSLTSGGIGGECMPTLYDDVFFDANSGFIIGSAVTIDIPLSYCKSIDWTGALNTPNFTSNQGFTGKFYVNGSLTFISNMNISPFTNIEFVSDVDGNTITSGGQHFSRTITLDGEGSWTLLDSLSVNRFILLEGSFYSNTNPINVRYFRAIDPSMTLDTLDLGNSNIHAYAGNGSVFIYSDTATLTSTYVNNLYTDLNNTNFYFNLLGGTPGSTTRNLSLVLSNLAYINKVIFSGSIQSTEQDKIVANGLVNINRVEMYHKGQIERPNITSSFQSLFHIDTVKMFNIQGATISGEIEGCDCNDIYIAKSGSVSRGNYNTVKILGNGEVGDGFFTTVDIYGNAKVETGTTFSIFQPTTFNKITLHGDGLINGDNLLNTHPLEVDTIKLTPGKAYDFEETMTITQYGWLDAIGTGSLPIIMRSTVPATQATIKSLTDTICLNYIFMQDLDTAGTALFRAGKISVDIANNTGWEFEDCCSSFGLSELFRDHDTTICLGESVDLLVYYGQCAGCTFQWTDGDTSELRTLSPTFSTTYTVAAIRPEGCYSIDTFRVNITTPSIINLQNDTTVSDISPPFNVNYQPQGGTWSGSGINNNGLFNPMIAGNGMHQLVYSINSNDCVTMDTMTIVVNSDACVFSPTHFYNNGFDVSCFGGNDGMVQISTVIGTGPFTYIWSNGQTDSIANNLAAGTYQVTIVDATNCVSALNVNITEPTILTSFVTITSNYNGQAISFPGASDGEATANPSGGTAPYTYLWNNGQTTQTALNLTAGTYTVTVTDANGCTDVQSVTLTEPIGFLSQISILSNYNGYSVACFNGNNGSAEINVVGGTSPYTYLWSNGQTDSIATGLSAGLVTVTVTDANNNSLISSTTLIEPTVLNTSITIDTSIVCHGFTNGSVTANATGGVLAYNYLWDDNSISGNQINLGIGNYFVTITDANGCIDSSSVVLTEPSPMIISITQNSIYNGFGVSCHGLNDGNVTANITGGTPNYSYNWNNGQTTAAATNLFAGMQIVTVTDANNCILTDSILITEPTILISSITIDANYNGFDISCNGQNDGAVTANISGGNGIYTYLWNNGQTTAALTNLTAGTYYLTATDNSGCSILDTVILNEPNLLNTSITIDTSILCHGLMNGSITANTTGGVLAYSYLWEDNSTNVNRTNLGTGNYFVTVTDANACIDSSSVVLIEPSLLTISITQDAIYNGFGVSCHGENDGAITANVTGGISNYTYNWNNGQTTAAATNLFAGMQIVTVTDANNCIITDSILITEPTILTSSITIDANYNGFDISCNGQNDGAVTANISGGNGIYNYLWNTGQTTASVTNLTAGTYYLTTTDNDGCSILDTVTLNEPNLLVISANITSNYNGQDISCFGNNDGMATVTASGGNGTYTYNWSNGATTPTINNLIAGTYTITVTDINGCTEVDNITLVEPAELSTILIPSNISCDGFVNITATTSGGTTNYNYQWNTNTSDTLNQILNVSNGNYMVTISDINNCQITDTLVVIIPPILSVNLGNDTMLCIGESLILNAIQPNIINYEWQDNSENPTFVVTESGLYTISILNDLGCTATDSIWVNYFDNSLNPLPTDTIICEDLDWLIDATVPTGNLYQWQDGTISPIYSATETGIYTVNITNITGCTLDLSTTVSFQNAPSIAPYLPTDTIICQNNPILLNAAAEFATTYIWEGESAFYGQNLPHDSTFIVTYPGTYNVNVSNYCGGFSQFIEVTEEDCGCYPYVPNAFTPNNDGRNDDFRVYANCILQNFEMYVYDRFGGILFISNDINDVWDGTVQGNNMMNGVYVWTLRFKTLNEKGELENQVLSGDVTIIR